MRFFALRHGESVPNIKGLIVSSPGIGTLPENGLTESGRHQASKAGAALADVLISLAANSTLPIHLSIISSDFSRALETAAIAFQVSFEALKPRHDFDRFRLYPVRTDIRLRERFFGDFDGGPNTKYEAVWDADVQEGPFDFFRVESVDSVARRTLELVKEVRKDAVEDVEHVVVFVSHGDSLQILQTVFEDVSPRIHRSLPHLSTAELRELITKNPSAIQNTQR
ncbi:hypothetical protein HDU97_003125 [Phlyctochytrium planicorne]|nr:hypothetical protein HDU97_003076 [Phlyctochytrium planicorne]KAJ3109696.1 hypothetical protein HDU97_003125 [Phlyctochytrium planicorne]